MAQPEDRPEPGAADGPVAPKKTAKVPAKTVPAQVPARVPAKKVPAKQSTPTKAAPRKAAPRKAAKQAGPPKAGTGKAAAKGPGVQPALAAPPPQAALTAGHAPAPAPTSAAAQRADTPASPGATTSGDYRLPVSLGLAAVGLAALVLSRLRRG